MIQDKIFFDEKDPTGLSYNTPFTFYGSYQGRLWSKSPSGSIQYYTQNSDLSAYATTGSNQFSGSQTVTGSLTVTGGIIGTAATSSYVEYSNVANKPTLVSGSSQVTYSGLTGIPAGIVSGSEQVTYSGLTGIPSGIVSGSAQIADFGIFATTGSNGFNGSQSITGSLTVTGQVVAQTLNVQQVTSSIVYSSGSNIFGNSLANTQQFTGSMRVTGSLVVAGAGTFSSSITVGSGVDGNGYLMKATDGSIIRVIDPTSEGGGSSINLGAIGSLTGNVRIHATDVLFLSNNGNTERMRIDSNGTMMLGGTSTTGTAGTGSGRGNLILGGSTSNKITFNNNSTTVNGYVYSDGSELQISSGAGFMNFYVGNAERMRIASTGAACFACELTAKSLGTNDLILNNLNHDHANYVDGTRGSWLIQEGACDLFIINQVSCKKYKFNLIEIK